MYGPTRIAGAYGELIGHGSASPLTSSPGRSAGVTDVLVSELQLVVMVDVPILAHLRNARVRHVSTATSTRC